MGSYHASSSRLPPVSGVVGPRKAQRGLIRSTRLDGSAARLRRCLRRDSALRVRPTRLGQRCSSGPTPAPRGRAWRLPGRHRTRGRSGHATEQLPARTEADPPLRSGAGAQGRRRERSVSAAGGPLSRPRAGGRVRSLVGSARAVSPSARTNVRRRAPRNRAILTVRRSRTMPRASCRVCVRIALLHV